MANSAAQVSTRLYRRMPWPQLVADGACGLRSVSSLARRRSEKTLALELHQGSRWRTFEGLHATTPSIDQIFDLHQEPGIDLVSA